VILWLGAEGKVEIHMFLLAGAMVFRYMVQQKGELRAIAKNVLECVLHMMAHYAKRLESATDGACITAEKQWVALCTMTKVGLFGTAMKSRAFLEHPEKNRTDG